MMSSPRRLVLLFLHPLQIRLKVDILQQRVCCINNLNNNDLWALLVANLNFYYFEIRNVGENVKGKPIVGQVW